MNWEGVCNKHTPFSLSPLYSQGKLQSIWVLSARTYCTYNPLYPTQTTPVMLTALTSFLNDNHKNIFETETKAHAMVDCSCIDLNSICCMTMSFFFSFSYSFATLHCKIMHYVSPTTYPAKLSPTSSRRESHISSTATAASSRSETVSSDEYPEHLTDNLLLPSIMAYKPLPRRLVTIRQDENVDFALYNNKHFSLEQETELCLSRIELRDSYSLDKMVDRAILFTYLGMRTAASLTTFLGNIHKAHAGQPQKQADIKHWFLNEIKKFETRPDHFSANRQANLVLMLRKFMVTQLDF